MRNHNTDSSFAPLLLFLSVGLSGCGEKTEETVYIRPVRAQQVDFQATIREYRLNGVIAPRREAELSFGAAGRLLQRPLDVGDRFRVGDLLGEIDATDYRKQLANVSAQLRAAESSLVNAAADLKRYQGLLKNRHVSQTDFDRQQNLHRVAEANVAALQAQRELAEVVIMKSRLVALEDGVVTQMLMEVGQELSPAQTVVRVAYVGVPEVVINLPENALDLITVGGELEVTLWALPGEHYRGVVREVAPQADRSGTYPVRAILPTASAEIHLGMTAEVTLSERLAAPVARLPLSALTATEAGESAVWVVDGESSQVRLVPVEVASLERDDALIVSGITSGEWVVTAGTQKLRPGEKVRLLR